MGSTATDAAHHVRTFRLHYGLTQTELASLLDVTRQTVTNWERGYPMTRLARYALLHLDYKLSTDYRLAPKRKLPRIKLEKLNHAAD